MLGQVPPEEVFFFLGTGLNHQAFAQEQVGRTVFLVM